MKVLDLEDVGPYLVERGVLGAAETFVVEPLQGGYVNRVFRVTTASCSYVVKQALPDSQRTLLRADIRREWAEVAAMNTIRSVVGQRCPIPEIVDHDPENFVSVMTAAPAGALLYESELLSGRLQPGVPALIGRYAAWLHNQTRDNPGVQEAFAVNPGFALRDQSIRSAIGANPDLGDRIAAVLASNQEHAAALVDADITPKNVLVHGQAITKLDFECTQWGDPALDVGIMLAHFVLLALARPQFRDPLVAAAGECSRAYEEASRVPIGAEFIARASDYGAAMMLGRVDGDLVLEYLRPVRGEVNALARTLLATPATSWEALAG